MLAIYSLNRQLLIHPLLCHLMYLNLGLPQVYSGLLRRHIGNQVNCCRSFSLDVNVSGFVARVLPSDERPLWFGRDILRVPRLRDPWMQTIHGLLSKHGSILWAAIHGIAIHSLRTTYTVKVIKIIKTL